MAVGSNNNNSTGGTTISTEKILLCIGIGLIASLGATFVVIKYKKDKENYNTTDAIEYVGNINTIEAIKDATSATSKLSNLNGEPSIEAFKATKRKGKHF